MSGRRKTRAKNSSSTTTTRSNKKQYEYARIESITNHMPDTQNVIHDFIISPENHSTPDMLSKPECARLVAERAKQLEEGCAPFINPAEFGFDNVIQIAEKELELGKCIFSVKRAISNRNIYEIVDPNRMS